MPDDRLHPDDAAAMREPLADGPGELRQQLSDAVVALFKQHLGRGPRDCRTYLEPDLGIVVPAGGYTAAERTVFEAGNGSATGPFASSSAPRNRGSPHTPRPARGRSRTTASRAHRAQRLVVATPKRAGSTCDGPARTSPSRSCFGDCRADVSSKRPAPQGPVRPRGVGRHAPAPLRRPGADIGCNRGRWGAGVDAICA